MAALSVYTQDTIPSSDPPLDQDLPPNKISAYYSLVFPTFTYYLQTLNVTIGRRCIPSTSASSSDNPQVDVDLGALKSVSRLHAKIEYEEDEERFVLVVIGRNGAWVDGVWSGSGSKVPLSERSQIQIASRTFHFVLPPPPAPEDSPSPSSQSSGNRARSPSVDVVDVTSLSPPSSIPSCSPPPAVVQTAHPKIPPLPGSQLPNSNAISKFKANPKKRRKSDGPPPPLPPPEVMPPKPQLTYAQLCYRAIKALGGKASLQDICQWIKETYEWFKYCEKDWESSVRHNLSSNPGFKKSLRNKDEKGKGALWLIDEAHEHTFEEQDAKKQAAAALGSVGGKDGKSTGKKGKAALPLEPALKRSVKGDLKGTLLPPPLTAAPLALKTNSGASPNHNFLPSPAPLSSTSPIVKLEPPSAQELASPAAPALSIPGAGVGNAGSEPIASTSSSASSFPAIPSSVRLPIIVGPVPGQLSQHDATPSPPKPIVLHDNMLILNPEIFSHLTPEHLRDLEALGAQKALEILQSYIVRYYKEKLKAEGGRGRGRGKPRRGRGGRGLTPAGSSSRADTPNSGPFTTAPLAPRLAKPPPVQTGATPDNLVRAPPIGSPLPPPVESAPSPFVVVDDDPSSDQEPVAKRRRLEAPALDVAPQ
ncbi:hypothetical protein B0H21DRAFT_692331 [Amylocystis lapponica]|nr:hypothetical protein B0H21DRAFT_692331 [Amylocystis lapponica]